MSHWQNSDYQNAWERVSGNKTFRFGIFELLAEKGELRKNGVLVRIAPQPFLVLIQLLENAGDIVTREDLQQRIWGASTIVEFDVGVNRCIRQIRSALSDSADLPRYVQTIPRKGHRFIAPVQVVEQRSAVLQSSLPAGSNPSAISQGTAPFPSPPAAKTHKRRSIALLAAAFAMLIGVLLFLRRSATISHTAVGISRIESLDPVPLVSYVGQEFSPSFSPDSRQVAFVWDGEKQNNFDLYVKRLDSQTVTRLTADPAIDYSPVFSPDGRWIAFCRGSLTKGGALMVIPSFGGPERKLTDLHSTAVPSKRALSWSPDGKWIVAGVEVTSQSEEQLGLALVNAQTGESRNLSHPDPADVDLFPSVAPNGKTVAFTRDIGLGVALLTLLPLQWNTATARATSFLPGAFDRVYAGNPAWTPDSRYLVFDSNRGGRLRLWIAPLDRPADAKPLENLGDNPGSPAIAKNGSLAYVHTTLDLNIWKVILKGNPIPKAAAPQIVIASTRLEQSPQVSPDGRNLVFASDRSGYVEIWRSGTGGENPKQLTTLMSPGTGSPAWSPDQRHVAFDSRVEGFPMIYVLPAEGGSPVKVTFSRSRNVVPIWSPDGKWIYFSSDRSGRLQIWRMTPSGESLTQITRNGGFAGQFSRDGKYLYFTRDNSPVSALWRMQLNTGVEELMVSSILARTFAPAHDGVYFMSERGAGAIWLQYQSLNSHQVTPVLPITKPVRWGVSLSPGERELYFGQVDRESSDLMVVPHFWE